MATRFAELLAVLARHGVDFVLVGSTAAVLAGAVYRTDDLDIVPDLEPGNLDRLIRALSELDARYLDPAGRLVRPDRERLAANRINLLTTSLGRLDVLKSIEPGRHYLELLTHSSLIEVEGAPVRVLSLEALIEAKEHAGRERDRAHLPILRETLRLAKLMHEG